MKEMGSSVRSMMVFARCLYSSIVDGERRENGRSFRIFFPGWPDDDDLQGSGPPGRQGVENHKAPEKEELILGCARL